jgi:hypothetical protein
MSERGKLSRFSPNRDSAKSLTLRDEKLAEFRPAKAHGPFKHRVEDRRQVARRRIDDLQDLSGRGLLPTRFCKFSLTLGKLTSQISYELLGIG